MDPSNASRLVNSVDEATLQKPNSSCRIDPTTEKCITGAHNVKYYHPDVMKAFQLYLMRNQTNQGRSSQVIKESTKAILDLGALAHVALTNRDAMKQYRERYRED